MNTARKRLSDSIASPVDVGVVLVRADPGGAGAAASRRQRDIHAELAHRVILGEVEMTLGDFNKMQVGDVLDLRKFDFARVLVDDIPLFESEIGTANGYAAARLLQAVELAES